MRAKFINEKFTEKTDPIQDMGIGIVAKMREKTKDWDVYDLSNYLDDECKHLKNFQQQPQQQREKQVSASSSWSTTCFIEMSDFESVQDVHQQIILFSPHQHYLISRILFPYPWENILFLS